jgi:hypothetical protein
VGSRSGGVAQRPLFRHPPGAGERFMRLEDAVTVLNQVFTHCRHLGMGVALENMFFPSFYRPNERVVVDSWRSG